METIRVMIAEDNIPLREMVADYLSRMEGIEVIGKAADGVQAMDMLRDLEPDVLICDMIMPQADGFAVLEQLDDIGLSRRPGTIALTALGRDDFISRAIDLGVDYYMVKPFDFRLLGQRVREAADHRQRKAAQKKREAQPAPPPAVPLSIEERIANLFLTVGIPAHIKGYQYLREAVSMVMEHPDLMGRITKELYPGIAKRFGTSASKVERAIRHAIEVAWNRGRIDALNEAFGRNVCSLDEKPTNGEFIALVADRLAIEQGLRAG